VSRDAPRRKRRALYVEVLLAAAAIGASYLLARAGPDRTGALSGIITSALIGLLALYLKEWAIQRSLKASFASIGILFMARLMVLAVGLGCSRAFGLNGVAFAAGFLSVYFVVQWIEIGYLSGERTRANREGF
jgi:hypothetical protein